MAIWKEFREFAQYGNVVDMAVGIIVGAAFGRVVQSMVAHIIMPPIGVLLGHVDFSKFFLVLRAGKTPGPYATLAKAQAAGAVTLDYGMFLNTVISFLIIAFCVFLLVRAMNRLRQPAPVPPTRHCPQCDSPISLKAHRCPFCTSDL